MGNLDASPIVEIPVGKAPRERQTIEVDGTWDIETEAWDKFVCGAIYAPGEKERVKVYSWDREEAFVDELLDQKRTLWAHNGGRFDTLWLLGHVWKRGLDAKIGLSGSSVASLDVRGSIFRDSARLAPMTLEKFSEIGSERKAATELPCSCPRRACGGYCSITRGMERSLYSRLVSYMVQDCRALYSALDALATFAERNDIDLRPTIGACAWATVMRGGVERADWGRNIKVTRAYTNTRSAYYGGRTQVLKPISANGFHYDLNSAYPAALANLSLPTGERTELDGGAASRAYGNGTIGVYRADLFISPLVFYPPLPVRTRTRIAYPVGHVSGWWTSLELQNAERRGASVRRVDGAVAWDSDAPLLADFCRRVWALRDAAGPKTALGTWTKWLANSLTGKLCTKPEVETISVDPDRPIFCPGGRCLPGLCGVFGCCEHRCTEKCGRATPIAAGFPVFSVKTPRLSSCSHVEWGAFLTSYTRCELQRFAGEGDDLVYCDTDSLFCEEARQSKIGPGLGEWKLEDLYAEFYALAPKTYEYIDAMTGECKAAAKGIPDAVRNFANLADGVVNDRGVNTFKRALQVGEVFQRRSLTRQIRPNGINFGDRVLRSDGKTYPMRGEELT